MHKTPQVAFERPEFHFCPAQNWINDPNGLFFDGTQYHLYFQHNPHGVEHGYMSWGHAISADLVDWNEQPIAITHGDTADIFSGSIVIDDENTSGLGDGVNAPIMAFYTAAATDQSNQSQALAYSLDGGSTFTQYASNPILDRGTTDFRDPKVFRYQSGTKSYWVMVAVEAVERRVMFYRSENLLAWTELSSFGPQAASFGVWECPDLFPLPVAGTDEYRWVLLVSLNPGGVAGGSGTQYFVGDFDGTRFTPDSDTDSWDTDGFAQLSRGRWLDWGRDFYAGVSFHGLPDSRRTLIAWMSNWDYARALPHNGWRGSMSAARILDLVDVGGRLEVRQQFAGLPATEPEAINLHPENTRIEVPGPGLLELDVVLDPESLVLLGLYRADGTLLSELRIEQQQLTHRREPGIVGHELYASTQRMPLPTASDAAPVRVLLDHGSVEILASGGLRSLSDQLTGESVPAYLMLQAGNHSVLNAGFRHFVMANAELGA